MGLQSGFDAFPSTDARVIGDIDGDDRFTGLDASLIARRANGDDVSEIPAQTGNGSSALEASSLEAEPAAVLASTERFAGSELPAAPASGASRPLLALDAGPELFRPADDPAQDDDTVAFESGAVLSR